MRNSNDSKIFGDDLIQKMAEQLGIEVKQIESKDRIKISSRDIGTKVETLGAGMARFAHRVWNLKKEGDNYYLERLEGEKTDQDKE